MFSTTITSFTFSTTHNVEASREGSPQMVQVSESDMLWQMWQRLISLHNLIMVLPNFSASPSSCLNKCRTKRKAVFLPIPGNLANSFTAFSRRIEEYCWSIRVVPFHEFANIVKGECRGKPKSYFLLDYSEPHPIFVSTNIENIC